MKNASRLLATLILLAFFVTLPVRPAAAATFQLSGRVTNQSGNPLVGSTVEVMTPGTGSVVASATTNTSGNYAVSVAEGTYDVRVTPPAGSGFGSAVALNRAITGDTNLDF